MMTEAITVKDTTDTRPAGFDGFWRAHVSALPPAWRWDVGRFLEYKHAGGCSDATLTTRFYQLHGLAEACGRPPSAVSTGDLLAVLSGFGSDYTRKSARNCFVTFFRYLRLAGLRGDDPAATLPNIRQPKPNPRPCPDRYIVDALREADATQWLMIKLAAECGLRRAEIARVHSDDLTGCEGRYSLIVHGKGGRQRVVPVADDVAGRIAGAGGWVFPGRFGGHVEASYVAKHLAPLLPDGYSPHKLRHRFATTAYAETHDLLAVSKALGHSNTEVTMVYVALADDSLRRITDATRIDDGGNRPACAQTIRKGA